MSRFVGMKKFSSKLHNVLLHLVFMFLKISSKMGVCSCVPPLHRQIWRAALQGKIPFLVTLIYSALVMSAPY